MAIGGPYFARSLWNDARVVMELGPRGSTATCATFQRAFLPSRVPLFLYFHKKIGRADVKADCDSSRDSFSPQGCPCVHSSAKIVSRASAANAISTLERLQGLLQLLLEPTDGADSLKVTGRDPRMRIRNGQFFFKTKRWKFGVADN